MKTQGISQIVRPRQPLMLFATEHFHKVEMMQHGIAHFYTFRVDSTNYDKIEVVPDGCLDIMFIRHKSHATALCIGTPTGIQRPRYFVAGDIVFGVRFLQGNLPWMRNCCAKELVDAFLDFDAVSEERDMVQRICACSTFQQQIQTFMNYYLPEYEAKRMQSLSIKHPAAYMLQRMMAEKGNLRIQALSQEMAFSERYLNELFRTAYGISPKEYEKIIRFQNILTQMEQIPNITDAAVDAGYYDHSHFLKEFRSIMHMTPKEYLKEYHAIQTDYRLAEYETETAHWT